MANDIPLKLADAEVPYSDFGEIRTIEIINPERGDGRYDWIAGVVMKIEAANESHHYFKMKFSISPQMREKLIHDLQNPDLIPAGPTPEEIRRIEAAYAALHPEKV